MPELCRHFGSCGGCTLQDLPDAAYLERKRAGVAAALYQRDIEVPVDEPVRVSPASRRRAMFAARKSGTQIAIGFRGLRSHAIVDMHECLVLTPGLFALTQGLRTMMEAVLRDSESAELHVTETDTGFDLALHWSRKTNAALVAGLAPWAERLGLARITSNGELVTQVRSPVVSFAGTEVALAPGAFLQPTREGEIALQEIVCEALADARNVLDLFAGCGTFSLALARTARVHAIDRDSEMLAALAESARHSKDLKPVTIERRDLFRHPLSPEELAGFGGAILDPPRAGAEQQARQLALSRLSRVAYASCDVKRFARDAAILLRGGFRLARVTPVDQFLWSDHIELVGQFERG